MLSLAGMFMIGRWMLLLLFFKNCSLSLFKGGVKINYGRFLPKKELLRPKTSELYLGGKGVVSLGRVCGGRKSVWRTKSPPRAAFFVWLATFGKILTLDNLRKRQVVVINRCFMCKKDGRIGRSLTSSL